MSTHIGEWSLETTDYHGPHGSPGGWKGPPAALAIFTEDETFACSDLESGTSTGSWLADGQEVLTDSDGELGVWQYLAEKDELHHELSDAQTGFRGGATWIYRRDPVAFHKRCLRHLQRIEGVGAKLAAKLWEAGARLPRDLSSWGEPLRAQHAEALGIKADEFARYCALAKHL